MSRFSGKLDNGDGDHVRATRSVRCVLTGQASGTTATFDLEALLAAQGGPALLANHKIVGAHLECETALTFTGGDTTGVTAVVGISGTLNGFLATAAITSMAAGDVSDLGGAGSLVGRARASTTALLTITATGGAPDVEDIATGVVWVHLEVKKLKERV